MFAVLRSRGASSTATSIGTRAMLPTARQAPLATPLAGTAPPPSTPARGQATKPLSKLTKPYKGSAEWNLKTTFLPPLSMLDTVPHGEGFSPEYIAERLTLQGGAILTNASVSKTRQTFDKVDMLEDFDDIFNTLPAPDLVAHDRWKSDWLWGEQRLAGVHPVAIRRSELTLAAIEAGKASADDDEFKVPSVAETARALLGPGPGPGAHTMFECDYMGDIPEPTRKVHDGPKRAVYPARALFVWHSTGLGDRGELLPVAIDVRIKHGKDVNVITPHSHPHGYWEAAKMLVHAADALVHEMRNHLYRAHFAQEPLAAVTGAHLDPGHPIRQLLTPHHRFLLANNDLGRKTLVNEGGIVDDLLGGTLKSSLALVKKAHREYDFDGHSFAKDIANRGVGKSPDLPHYPYRDDGMLLWDAIGTFVEEYIAAVYKSAPLDVQVLNWFAALQTTGESEWPRC